MTTTFPLKDIARVLGLDPKALAFSIEHCPAKVRAEYVQNILRDARAAGLNA